MTNNKDFIVSNLVEVGGSIKETLGTVTGADLDLSTGNYFKLTDGGDSVITFSNPAQNQSFQLELTYGRNTFQLPTAPEVLGESSPFHQHDNGQLGLFIRADGYRAYTHGAQYDRIYQRTILDWDLSTFGYSYTHHSSDVNHASGGLFFKPDGTKVYLADQTRIKEYSISTPWDVSSTLSLTYEMISSLGTSFRAQSPKFKPDGTKLFITTESLSANPKFEQYDLSTPWDLSTATSEYSISLAAFTDRVISFDFSSDGMTVVMLTDEWVARQYTLSTAWDISNFNASNYDLEVTLDDTGLYAARSLQFNSEGTELVALSHYSNSTTIMWFEASSQSTISWPDSIRWAGGNPPVGSTYQTVKNFTFVTTDGGTSYTGYVDGENYS